MVCATKKIPAANASGKAKEKTEPGTRIASRLSLVVCATKKMPALSAGEKAKEKTEPGMRIASRLSLVVCATKKMPALSAGEKAKEKTEPGTRIASRLSLVEATGLEPAASWSQTKHSTKLSYASSSHQGNRSCTHPRPYHRYQNVLAKSAQDLFICGANNIIAESSLSVNNSCRFTGEKWRFYPLLP